MRKIVFSEHALERAKERDLEYLPLKSVFREAYRKRFKKYKKYGEFKLRFGSIIFVCVGTGFQIRVLTIYRKI